MLVKDVMTHPVITVEPDTTIERAWSILQEHHIRHLPVVQDGDLIGTISERDVRAALARAEGCDRWAPTIDSDVWRGAVFGRRRTTAKPTSSLEPPPVVNFIVQELVVTVAPDTPVDEAGRLMLEHKIGALPVVQDSELVGIVTESDLLRVLLTMLELSTASAERQHAAT